MFKRTIKIIKEVFTNPSEFFMSVRREKSISNVLFFFLILTLFYIIVTVPAMIVQDSMLVGFEITIPPVAFGAFAAIFYATIMFMASFITLFIFSAILHIGVYFMKGKGGIRETIKAYGYSQAPSLIFGGIISYLLFNETAMLFGLVPIVVIAVWTIVLTVIGLQKLHGMTLGRAILAFLISIAVTFLIGVLFVLLMILVAYSAGTIPV